MNRSLGNFSDQVDTLTGAARSRMERLYYGSFSPARLRIPPEMRDRTVELFGQPGESQEACVRRIESQPILRIVDRWTLQASVFSPLRAQRPRKQHELPEAHRNPDFSTPHTRTPSALWGRIEGKQFLSCENLCGYASQSGVVLAKEMRDSLQVARDSGLLTDLFVTAEKWFEAAHASQPAAIYPMLGWNAGKVAGATDERAHVHTILAEGMPSAAIELHRRASVSYRRSHSASYSNDRYDTHADLDLVIASEGGVEAIATLTPWKEKGVEIRAHGLESCLGVLHKVLNGLIQEEGVRAFNLMAYWRPLRADGQDWKDVPPLTLSIVERTDHDWGWVEMLAGESVVSYCPFAFARRLRAFVGRT